MEFWRAVEILKKRWGLIAASVLITCFLTFGMLRLLGSNWQATVKFVKAPTTRLPAMPGQNESDSETYVEGAPAGQGRAADFETLVKSPEVLKPALGKLPQPLAPDDALQGIKVLPVSARVFALQVQDSNPERAGILANALADQLVMMNRALHTRQAEEDVKLRQDELRKAKLELMKTQNQLEAFKSRYGILGNQTDDLQVAVNRLQQAYRDYDDVSGKLVFAEARLNASRQQLQTLPRTITVSRPASENPTIKKLEEDQAAANSRLTALRARYTDDHIEVQIAKATFDGLTRQLQEELQKNSRASLPQPNPELRPLQQSIASLQREVNGYRAHANTLTQTINSARNSMRITGSANGPMGRLAAEITEQTENISLIKAHLNRAQTALDIAKRQNPLMIVSRVEPFNPPLPLAAGRTKKFLFVAFVCSLMLACAFVLLNDLADRRVKTVEDAELLLPLPVTAAIPLPQTALSPAQLARITEIAPQSLNSEAYHFLALRLLNMSDQKIRSAMVVSAKAGQGTTQTVTNLGITLAQAGYRVVIVDANFRTPKLHELFGLSNDFGVTDLLEEPEVSLGHVLHETSIEHLRLLRTEKKRAEAQLLMALHPTSVENLHVITSGKPPANPWELFRSRNLKEISSRLEEFADYVLFDTPSALAFTDALNLTPVADGAFFCVRALETPSGAEERLMEHMKAANVVNLGVVLTDVPAEMLDSTPNYQHYYPSPAPTGAAPKSVARTVDAPQLQPGTPLPKNPAIIDIHPTGPTREEGWNDYVVEEMDDPKEAKEAAS
ncbi:MAG: hypothetical protein KY468_04345 [Armatimonadetes bacterium]|nr:hypothetical protein [Armatimonadota bacterium]